MPFFKMRFQRSIMFNHSPVHPFPQNQPALRTHIDIIGELTSKLDLSLGNFAKLTQKAMILNTFIQHAVNELFDNWLSAIHGYIVTIILSLLLKQFCVRYMGTSQKS